MRELLLKEKRGEGETGEGWGGGGRGSWVGVYVSVMHVTRPGQTFLTMVHRITYLTEVHLLGRANLPKIQKGARITKQRSKPGK